MGKVTTFVRATRHKTNVNYENLMSDKVEKEWQRICFMTI